MGGGSYSELLQYPWYPWRIYEVPQPGLLRLINDSMLPVNVVYVDPTLYYTHHCGSLVVKVTVFILINIILLSHIAKKDHVT